MPEITELSDEELAAKLKTAKTTTITVGVIFALIIVGWFVFGQVTKNIPVFISTPTLAIVSLTITSAAPRKIRAEIERRAAK